MVMKKINILDIYHKKQRKKRILIYGFAFIFAFMTVLLMFAALCRESILGLLLAAGVSESLSYAVYGFLYAYGFVPCLYGLCVRKRKDGVFRFLLSLNRPCCNCFDVKTHEIKSVRVHQRVNCLRKQKKNKKRKLIN